MSPIKTRQMSGSLMISRMKGQIHRHEKHYEMTSEKMLSIIRENPSLETREIGKWMQTYTVLRQLCQIGTAGTRSRTTAKSTKSD